MTPWPPVTIKDNPTAHIRTDGIEFVLTQADRSIAAQAAVQLEANRRRQNGREADRALATWKGDMLRVGPDTYDNGIDPDPALIQAVGGEG